MKKEYNPLQKKYKLPSMKEMNADFQISSIEAKEFILKEIIKKMNEKIEIFTHLMEEILNPETRLGALHESSMFSDSEKKEVLKVFRKLQFNQRKNLNLEISYDEKETAKQINGLFKDWQEIKPVLKKIITKIQDSWNRDKKTKLELNYFG